MNIVRGFFDRVVLLASFLVAGCVPGFIAQYRQRLGGALDQVLKDLAPFREIANRLHGGSLDKLIEHHVYSADPTFQAEGNAIQAMVRSLERLRASVEALDTDLVHQILVLLRRADLRIVRATWDAYEPALSFSPEALLFAAAVALAVWLLFMLGWVTAGAFVFWLRRVRA
jgi:Protein of unknown function (DUF2937)